MNMNPIDGFQIGTRLTAKRKRFGLSAFMVFTLLMLVVAVGICGAQLSAKPNPLPSGPATAATRAANQAVLASLPFSDREDFENARRGFIAAPERLTIRNAEGAVVWDLESYASFITPDVPAPDSVNPSLWRIAQLNLIHGLFQVSERIYQVRGYDVSNITFVRGDTGWIVFDPLISVETAKAAYEFVTQRLGPLPVRAVVYSHSHVDHFGGVRGIVDEADVDAGKVRIIAPEGFMEEAVSENVIAGTAMGRRAIYMYGSLLPRGERGGVSAGLGQTTSTGTISLIAPTDTITKTGQELTIDGVRMVFQMTPGTEAPAEMNTWFPQWNALWMAENVQNTLHNLYTLRGAKVRDALQWSKYIDETVELYGAGAEVKFQSHHWPLWGNAKILDYLAKQRDLYKYIHDQSVRMLNQGATGPEIAEALRLPPELDLAWYNRGYYGTVKHDARAVYQRYMGWYDANPANLDPLPPEPAAKKYVEYMGGEAAILARARVDFEAGEYRWVAEALKHAVFANPESDAARELLADTFEQLGYQAESGAWRSVYLQGAFELRHGIPDGGGGANNSPDVFRAMPPEMLFDYLAIRLDAPKAAGKKLVLVLNFTDLGSQYALLVQNSVLHNYSGPAAAALAANADATLTLSKTALYQILRMEATPAQKVESGELRISGRRDALGELLGMMAPTPFWFPIVTP